VLLDGRRLYVAYGSDVTCKEGVQLAIERPVWLLLARGAEILVVYLPDAPDGSKCARSTSTRGTASDAPVGKETTTSGSGSCTTSVRCDTDFVQHLFHALG
jgi:hypothetical protein